MDLKPSGLSFYSKHNDDVIKFKCGHAKFGTVEVLSWGFSLLNGVLSSQLYRQANPTFPVVKIEVGSIGH